MGSEWRINASRRLALLSHKRETWDLKARRLARPATGRIGRWFSESRQLTVAVVGLDQAGKTTVVNCLTGRPLRKTVPTVGQNKARKIGRPHGAVRLFDLGGGVSIRETWAKRLLRAHGAIFVVDVCDENRFAEARIELAKYLGAPEFYSKPVVILANKSDRSNKSISDIETLLGLRSPQSPLPGSPWRVVPTVALVETEADVDVRIMDAVRWLEEQVHQNWKVINHSVLNKDLSLKRVDLEERYRNKLSVSAKRRAKGKKGSATVAPAQGPKATAPVAAAANILCKNVVYSGNESTTCSRAATTRSATTGWLPFCAECAEVAAAAAKEAEKKKEDKEQSLKSPLELAAASVKSNEELNAGTSIEVGASIQAASAYSPSPSPSSRPISPRSAASSHKPRKERKEKKDRKDKKKKEKKEKKKKHKKSSPRDDLIHPTLKVDDRVEANFRAMGKWFPGTISWVNDDGSVSIKYDDGDSEDQVEPGNVLPVENSPILANGTHVQVRYRGKVKFFNGTIAQLNQDGTYTVKYEDGDEEPAALRSWIRIRRF